mmetsp:Transcript_2845/g.7210  ORF Transcript_2845/g.7210 Transcript_2845/m.7210 type:complete len:259 (+) Transcript_2845:524-1300(+)
MSHGLGHRPSSPPSSSLGASSLGPSGGDDDLRPRGASHPRTVRSGVARPQRAMDVVRHERIEGPSGRIFRPRLPESRVQPSLPIVGKAMSHLAEFERAVHIAEVGPLPRLVQSFREGQIAPLIVHYSTMLAVHLLRTGVEHTPLLVLVPLPPPAVLPIAASDHVVVPRGGDVRRARQFVDHARAVLVRGVIPYGDAVVVMHRQRLARHAHRPGDVQTRPLALFLFQLFDPIHGLLVLVPKVFWEGRRALFEDRGVVLT